MSQAEIDECRNAFDAFDIGRRGFIKLTDLSNVFEKLDKWLPNEEQLYQMTCTLQLQTLSGNIDFSQFLAVAAIQRDKAENVDFETDMVDVSFILSFGHYLYNFCPQIPLLHILGIYCLRW